MSQTSIIFGALLLGYVVYITLRGELPTYAGFLLGGFSTKTAAPTSVPYSQTPIGSATSPANAPPNPNNATSNNPIAMNSLNPFENNTPQYNDQMYDPYQSPM